MIINSHCRSNHGKLYPLEKRKQTQSACTVAAALVMLQLSPTPRDENAVPIFIIAFTNIVNNTPIIVTFPFTCKEYYNNFN